MVNLQSLACLDTVTTARMLIWPLSQSFWVNAKSLQDEIRITYGFVFVDIKEFAVPECAPLRDRLVKEQGETPVTSSFADFNVCSYVYGAFRHFNTLLVLKIADEKRMQFQWISTEASPDWKYEKMD